MRCPWAYMHTSNICQAIITSIWRFSSHLICMSRLLALLDFARSQYLSVCRSCHDTKEREGKDRERNGGDSAERQRVHPIAAVLGRTDGRSGRRRRRSRREASEKRVRRSRLWCWASRLPARLSECVWAQPYLLCYLFFGRFLFSLCPRLLCFEWLIYFLIPREKKWKKKERRIHNKPCIQSWARRHFRKSGPN